MVLSHIVASLVYCMKMLTKVMLVVGIFFEAIITKWFIKGSLQVYIRILILNMIPLDQNCFVKVSLAPPYTRIIDL